MWPVSERFRNALTRDHTIVTKAEILEGEIVLAELASQGVLVDGSVKADRSAVQRTADVTLVDRDGSLTPRDINDLLVPSGRQIRLYRGIEYPERLPGDEPNVEYVPIGTFRFTEVDVTYPEIKLGGCYDRSWIISGERLPFNVYITAQTNVVEIIQRLIQTAYPGVPMDFPITNEGGNSMVFDQEADPWEVCQTLTANLGLRLFFDPMGVAVMRPEPTEWDIPVWEYDDTDPRNIGLPGVSRTWTGTGYNGVIVIAENSDLPSPLWAAAYDTDPNSPTQWGGVYGKRNMFVRDETIGSQWQAQQRAQKELQAQLGFLESITIPTMVNPAYEVGDVVRVSYARADLTDRPVIKEKYLIVDGFEVPLRADGNQTLTTRARRIVLQ